MRQLRSLQWRLTFVYGVLLVSSMGVVSSLLATLASDTYRSSLDERLEQESRLLGETIEAYFAGRMTIEDVREHIERDAQLIGAQITLVSAEGAVIADSSGTVPTAAATLLTRPEIAEALAVGVSRRSAPDGPRGSEVYYTAAAIEIRGTRVGVARLAVPASEVESHVGQILRNIIVTDALISLFAAAAVFILAQQMSRSVHVVTSGARRLADGELDHRIAFQGFDETKELAEAFNQMAGNLQGMLEKVSDERGRVALILETLGDGVLLLAGDGTIRSYNPTAARFLRWDEGEAPEGSLNAVLKDPGLVSFVEETLQGTSLVQREVLLFGQQPLSVIGTPVVQDGTADALVTMHDLTPIRRVEDSQQKFVSNVSHELRSPLAAIAALTEALESGALEDEGVARDFVARIQREAGRMTLLVDDLLELSRLETRDSLTMASVDVLPLLEEIKDGLDTGVSDREARVEWAIPDHLPAVRADRERLRRVFLNLLGNALKFTTPSGTVSVSARETAGAVEFTVRDTGEGIPEGHLPRIFDRFFQGDPSRVDGTGLGLPIVKQILEAHGGAITVETTAGMGSAFVFTIPQA